MRVFLISLVILYSHKYMTIEEALNTPNARFWDVESIPVIETQEFDFWAFAPGSVRMFSGGSVERNGGEISRERFLDLMTCWKSGKLDQERYYQLYKVK